MQSRVGKSGGAEQEHATLVKGMSRSHHVEVVLERILAKRRLQQEHPPSDLDWEEKQETETEQPAKESG